MVTLQQWVQQAKNAAAAALEQCDFCSASISSQHRHLLELESRDILCACRPCSILFDKQEASLGKYRLIGERRLYLPTFAMNDGQWESLRLPVGLAFFFYSTPAQRVVAYYPSPMGPAESLLRLTTWDELAACNPILHGMEQDVEALLVNRTHNARQYFLVPIDDCYRLVGLLRSNWHGLSGGQEVWTAIARFFQKLLQTSQERVGNS